MLHLSYGVAGLRSSDEMRVLQDERGTNGIHPRSRFVSAGLISSMSRFWPFGVRAMSPFSTDRISLLLRSLDSAVANPVLVLFFACLNSTSFGKRWFVQEKLFWSLNEPPRPRLLKERGYP